MELWLIRHGESEANAGRPSETPGGTPLTEKGHRQGQAVADTFEEPPGLVVVSPFLRSQQTAAPLLKKFNLTPETWPVQEWVYLEPSRYRGTTEQDRRPSVREYLEKNDPNYRDGQDAESFRDLLDRVDEFGEHLEQAIERVTSVVAFSHGRFMKAILWKLFCGSAGIPENQVLPSYWAFSDCFSVPNGLIIQLRRGPYGWFLRGRRDVRLQADEKGLAPR